MKSRDFCYWLQGFFELTDKQELTPYQVKLISKHLNMVFQHEIDPSFGKDLEVLKAIHTKVELSDKDKKELVAKIFKEIEEEKKTMPNDMRITC